MKIEQIPTADLIPYARNTRTHSPEQVAQIAGSIREFGFTNPILIDGENGIIAGHGRVMAASKLGLAKVPCIRLAHLTDTHKRAYIIADNKLALNAGWDEEMLGLELADLRELDFNLGLVGFTEEELGDLGKEEENVIPNDVTISSCFEVIAECQHEEEQSMVYNLLNEKGIKCRLATL
jgi:ParB-like chromosome segregation protein Spo0J